MKRAVIAVAFILCAVISVRAESSGAALIGGYDVTKVAAATVEALASKNILSADEANDLKRRLSIDTSSEPLIAAASIVDFYERLGVLLLARQFLTDDEVAGVKQNAAASGGVKAGGLNPVVLAASYLDMLVGKGIIFQPAAQSILDDAKTGRR